MPINFHHLYLNQISFKGNENDTLEEDKTPIELEEEKLTDLLVKSALKDKPSPSAILMYSENSKKSSALLEKVAKKADLNVVELNTSYQDCAVDVFEALKNSRRNYLNTKQRTIILIKNSEALFSNTKANYKNVNIIKNFIEECSQIPTNNFQNAYAATLVFETSNPQALSDEILKNKNLNGSISVLSSSTKEIEEIITSFIVNKGQEKGLEQIDSKEIKKLSQQLSPNSRLGGYSDEKIVSMLNKALIEWEHQSDLEFNKILNEKIKTTRRDIPPRIITNSLESRKWLIENGWVDVPGFKNIDIAALEKVLYSCEAKPKKEVQEDELSQILAENNAFIQNVHNYDSQSLKNATIEKKPLVELWLSISKSALANRENDRLKNMWFDDVLSDKGRTDELISETIAMLKNKNAAISFAKTAYSDILENDDTLSAREKAILMQHQKSISFFDVATFNITSNRMVELEDRIISILKTLSKEEDRVLANAEENIFEPARNVMILSSENIEDNAIVNYIFQLLSQYAADEDEDRKEALKELLQEFNLTKNAGDVESLNLTWQKMIDYAQEYFEKTVLNDLTNENITLLGFIAKEKENIQDKTILKLLDNNLLTIEQKAFIARYAKDNNFKSMIKNQNIDIASTLEELVFFEAGNKDLIEQASLSLSKSEFEKIMSDKFKEINRNAKDVNIQGNKIVSKLDEINSSIDSQSKAILDFANNFSDYANTSLSFQFAQLGELTKINEHTSDIKRHIQVLTRAKLLELEKNKYYSEIVPDLTKLLPEGEQVDINDFLTKVDELAKKEKNALRKKKIIKAASIIAGVAATGAAVYYFGPAIMGHLFSQVSNPILTASAITQTSTNVQLARKLGNSRLLGQLSFGHYSSDPKTLQNEIEQIEKEIKRITNKSSLTSSDMNRLHELEIKLKNHKKWLQEALKKIKSQIK